MEWGDALYDKYDDLLKHYINSMEFLEHFSRVIQDRIKFENDYAKTSKRMPSKCQLKKKDDYGGPPLSYEDALEKTLDSIRSVGLQHEAIADSLKQQVLDPVVKYIHEMKKRKSHFQSEFKRLERQLTQSLQALDSTFQRYRRAHGDMIRAEEAYKVAEENRDLARSEVDKHKVTAETKKSECDAMKANYASQLEITNTARNNYFNSALPKLLQEMQEEDKQRTVEFTRLLTAATEAERSVMGTIESCHNDMITAAQSISWEKDNQKMVENMRSGHLKPDDMPFSDLDVVSAAGSIESLTHSNTGTIRGKKEKKSGGLSGLFGTRKPAKESANFSHLGPEQQRKKLNEKIHDVKSAMSKDWKELESLRKLKSTYTDKNQIRAIQSSISEAEARYEKLQQELSVWEGYLREATGGEAPNGRLSKISTTSTTTESTSRPVSVAPSVAESAPRPARQSVHSMRSDDFSDDEFGPPTGGVEQQPQVQQQPHPQQQQEQVAFIGGCTAVYDYVNETGDGLSMHQGDQFYVVAADSGDGWTLVSSLDSTQQGYVPSGYINIQYY